MSIIRSLFVCPNPAGFFSVSVVCLVCNKSIILHQRDTSNKSSPSIISNWTRHGKNCYVAAYATGSTKNQCNLDKYFGSGRSSQSGDINQEENQAHQTVPRLSDLNNNVSPNSSSSSCMPVSNVTGFAKTCIVHTSTFSTLKIHKICYAYQTGMKLTGIVELLSLY